MCEDLPDDAAGSCSVAISRSRPPATRARQDINRERARHQSCPAPGARTVLPLCALRTCGPRRRQGRELRRHARPYATTRVRQRARAASTPWQISRFVSGRGVIAAKRSNNSSGSNTSSRVPSCQARFRLNPAPSNCGSCASCWYPPCALLLGPDCRAVADDEITRRWRAGVGVRERLGRSRECVHRSDVVTA